MARNEKLSALCNKIPARLTKAEMEKYHDMIKERDMTPVTGVFRNLDKPGTSIKFPFRVHKGPIEIHELKDGCIYTKPYALAFHLEHKCNKIQFKRGNGIAGSRQYDSNGIAVGAGSEGMEGGQAAVETYMPRFSFLSTDVPQRGTI